MREQLLQLRNRVRRDPAGHPLTPHQRHPHLVEIDDEGGGVDLVEGAAEFEAIEHRGFHTGTKEEIEGFVGKELRGEGQWPIGKSSAIEDHPFNGLTGGDRLLFIRCKTSVDDTYKSSIVDDGGNESHMV